MIEAKLLIGRFLTLTPAPSRGLVPTPAAFEAVVCPTMQIEESTRKNPGAMLNPMRNVGGIRQSATIAGANMNKVHRNFKWLPWYQGDISETVLDHDVLTGPMSGCDLVTYSDAAGTMKAGHLGTVDLTTPNAAAINAAVKALWNGFANANPGQVLGGFNPTGLGVPAFLPFQGDDVVGKTWGLMTTGGQFFSLHVWLQKNTYDHYRIAGVHQIPSMTLAQLQNI